MNNPDDLQSAQSTMRIDITPGMLEQIQQAPVETARRTVRVGPRPATPAAPAPPTIRIQQQPVAPVRPLGGEDFQTLLQSIYDAVFLADMQGRILGANGRAEQFFASTRAELCKKNILDLLCGSEADDSLLQTITATLAGNRFVLLQAVCRRTDDTLFPAEISACRLVVGGKPYLGFFLRDITIRKETEERLRTGYNALQNAAGGIAVTGLDGLLSGYVNPAMRALLGFAEEDDPALYDIRQFIVDEAAGEAMFAAAGRGEPWEGVVEMRKKDGSTWFATAALAGNLNPDGVVTGVVVSLLDVTPQRLAQEQLRQRNTEMAADLRMARDLQIAFLPAEYPSVRASDGSGLAFAHVYRPSGLVGGDFFSILPIDSHRAMVFIADVMGHGARAALVVATLRGLLESVVKTTHEPGAFLTRLNAAYSRIFAGAGELMFATASCVLFDIEKHHFTLANAGHPQPILTGPGGATIVEIPESALGPAIGLLPDSSYSSCTNDWQPGQRLLFYTDGLTEAHVGALGEEFGEERLLEVLRNGRGLALDTMISNAVAEASAFVNDNPFEDDVCVLAVEFAKPATTSPGDAAP